MLKSKRTRPHEDEAPPTVLKLRWGSFVLRWGLLVSLWRSEGERNAGDCRTWHFCFSCLILISCYTAECGVWPAWSLSPHHGTSRLNLRNTQTCLQCQLFTHNHTTIQTNGENYYSAITRLYSRGLADKQALPLKCPHLCGPKKMFFLTEMEHKLHS